MGRASGKWGTLTDNHEIEGAMKPGSPNGKQRSRGRNNMGGKKHMPPRNQTFDSTGPEIRVRGNAHQVMEKYLAMARDASSQGDRVAAENYYQHAEHYFRVINAHNSNNPNGNGQRRPAQTPAEDQAPGAEQEEGEDGAEAASDEGQAQAVNA